MGDICPGAWCRSRRVRVGLLVLLAMLAGSGWAAGVAGEAGEGQARPRLAYLVSDLRIPFWDILWRGIRSRAEGLGYRVQVYSANNGAKRELEHAVKVIRGGVDGIIVSPTNSSACATILKFARQGGIPVVIADVGTDGGAFVSYISSDNRDGAYRIGKVLTRRMHALGWGDGRVGIIAIPQTRENGRARTAGFMEALDEAGIRGAGIRQQVDFSYQETYPELFIKKGAPRSTN
ncbi:MAG: hypothetical protein B0D89_11350 [Candidatus Sedimenticola endophacoides]|nr:MAG: hypothetical protein B0D89_11350 [Candidatus Sedimenticola endophacoides]